jgi:hypothetical protein
MLSGTKGERRILMVARVGRSHVHDINVVVSDQCLVGGVRAGDAELVCKVASSLGGTRTDGNDPVAIELQIGGEQTRNPAGPKNAPTKPTPGRRASVA